MLQILLIAALGFAALLAAGAVFEKIAQARFARRYPPPGRLIDIGGRRVHILPKGEGAGPTVVIEQGAGGPAVAWAPIQNRLSAFARVCLYDRPGYQWSDPGLSSLSLIDRAEALRALLKTADEPGPYVLVGHSYGAVICQVFAAAYPQDTAGLVLVDTPEQDVIFRPSFEDYRRKFVQIARIGSGLARFGVVRLLMTALLRPDAEMTPELNGAMIGFISHPKASAQLADELRSLAQGQAEIQAASRPGALGDLPLAVITHTKPFPGFAGLLEPGWMDGQRRLAALSSRGTLIMAEKSNHMIQADEPDLVVEAIRRIHAQAMADAPA